MGRGLGIFPTRPKTPFVPGRGFTRDKRGASYIFAQLRLPPTRIFLICAASPSSRPSRLLLRRRPRAPSELRRLHAPAALDDDPARPLTGKPQPAELFAAAARCASCSRRPPRHASTSTGAARPYWCSHHFAPLPPGPTAAGTAAPRLPCFAPPLGHRRRRPPRRLGGRARAPPRRCCRAAARAAAAEGPLSLRLARRRTLRRAWPSRASRPSH